jgi:hypothetical protein
MPDRHDERFSISTNVTIPRRVVTTRLFNGEVGQSRLPPS